MTLRILVIDDNAHAADTLAIVMGYWGHDVRVAHDGPLGLELAEEFRPDVVILDIEMPSMSGFEVATRLREMPIRDGIAVIALTGHDLRDLSSAEDTLGFDHCLRKPLSFEQLERLLAKAQTGRGRAAARRRA